MSPNKRRVRVRQSMLLASLLLLPLYLCAQSSPQTAGFGACKPVSERTGKVGCWIIVDNPVGRPDQAQVFWYLDAYPTRAAAQEAKEGGGTVLESLGRVWLLTIGKPGLASGA